MKEQLGVIDWEYFEKYIHNLFNILGAKITNFEVSEKKEIKGIDGEYEIDVSVTFEMFGGAKYTTLIECKSYKKGNNVSRDLVMVLNQKLQSLGAQKGIMITTSDFQSGAVEFATQHGIALIKIYDKSMTYMTKGYNLHKPTFTSITEIVGYQQYVNEEGHTVHTMVEKKTKDILLPEISSD